MRLSGLRRWFGAEPSVLLATGEGYALWADRYPPRPHNPLMAAEQSVVEPILTALSPARALDLGTGTGRNLSLMAASGARLIVGLDLSPAMLAHHEAKNARVCADACRLPFADRTFDVVCSSLMAGDVGDIARLVSEAARVLTPGGHIVYSDFHPSWASGRWRRTFRAADGRQCELPYFAHSIDEHLQGLDSAGFQIQSIREPRIRARAEPVVVVFHAVKPGAVIRRSTLHSNHAGVSGPPGPLL